MRLLNPPYIPLAKWNLTVIENNSILVQFTIYRRYRYFFLFSSDQLMLGIGIGCACGATATLILVFIVSFFKSKCRSPKIASPRVKTVEPMNGGPHMRTPSVNGSVDSSDSISHSRNGFIRRPLTTSRRSSMIDGKSNGFLPWCITGPRLWKRKYRSVEHCNWNEKGSHIQCYVAPCREASCASHKGDARDTNTRQSPRPFDPTERYRC